MGANFFHSKTCWELTSENRSIKLLTSVIPFERSNSSFPWSSPLWLCRPVYLQKNLVNRSILHISFIISFASVTMTTISTVSHSFLPKITDFNQSLASGLGSCLLLGTLHQSLTRLVVGPLKDLH